MNPRSSFAHPAILLAAISVVLAGCASKPSGPARPATIQPIDNADQIGDVIARLERGEAKEAKKSLETMRKRDPNDARAAVLLESIESDPQTILGAQSFGYTAKPGDSFARWRNAFSEIATNSMRSPAIMASTIRPSSRPADRCGFLATRPGRAAANGQAGGAPSVPATANRAPAKPAARPAARRRQPRPRQPVARAGARRAQPRPSGSRGGAAASGDRRQPRQCHDQGRSRPRPAHPRYGQGAALIDDQS